MERLIPVRCPQCRFEKCVPDSAAAWKCLYCGGVHRIVDTEQANILGMLRPEEKREILIEATSPLKKLGWNVKVIVGGV